MKRKATFRLAYDGEALRDGRMDVRDLAPALLAVGALCERANELLNEGRTSVRVQAQAGFEAGSFEVFLHLDLSVLDQIKGFLNLESIRDADELLRILGLGGVAGAGAGLIQLLRKLAGREPDEIEEDEDGTRVRIGDTNVVVINHGVINLLTDPEARQRLEGMVRPLEREGIEELIFREGGEVFERIEEEEVEYYRAPAAWRLQEEPLVPESEITMAFELGAVPFREGLKWRLQNDSMKIAAAMEDEAFEARVRAGEAFRKGDVLIVRLRTRVSTTAEGKVCTEHAVLRVLEHRSRPNQLDLPESLE